MFSCASVAHESAMPTSNRACTARRPSPGRWRTSGAAASGPPCVPSSAEGFHSRPRPLAAASARAPCAAWLARCRTGAAAGLPVSSQRGTTRAASATHDERMRDSSRCIAPRCEDSVACAATLEMAAPAASTGAPRRALAAGQRHLRYQRRKNGVDHEGEAPVGHLAPPAAVSAAGPGEEGVQRDCDLPVSVGRPRGLLLLLSPAL